MNLKGKNALITGGGRGLGKAKCFNFTTSHSPNPSSLILHPTASKRMNFANFASLKRKE